MSPTFHRCHQAAVGAPRAAEYLRYLAIIAVIGVMASMFTRAGIVGCTSWGILDFLPSLPKGLLELMLAVPVCNGLLAYIGPVMVAIILFRRPFPVLLTLLVCAMAEMGYRAIVLHDLQWVLIMPAWKTVATLALVFPILLAHLIFKK